jgi:hypothetical protein
VGKCDDCRASAALLADSGSAAAVQSRAATDGRYLFQGVCRNAQVALALNWHSHDCGLIAVEKYDKTEKKFPWLLNVPLECKKGIHRLSHSARIRGVCRLTAGASVDVCTDWLVAGVHCVPRAFLE